MKQILKKCFYTLKNIKPFENKIIYGFLLHSVRKTMDSEISYNSRNFKLIYVKPTFLALKV